MRDHHQLDELDRAIIERLRVDGRESSRSLATALGTNKTTVAHRIRLLEEHRVMRVVAVRDLFAFGHQVLAFAMIRVADAPITEVALRVAALPDAIGVTVRTGGYDVMASLLARDLAHLGELTSTVLPRIDGVAEVHGELVTEVVKYDSHWALLSGPPPGDLPDPAEPGSRDDLDLAILRRLNVDARRSNRGIAAELGTSEATVRARIRRMQEDRAIRIQAISDVRAFGIGANAVVGIQTADGRTDEAVARLAAVPEVSMLTRTFGRQDLIAMVLGPDAGAVARVVLATIADHPTVRRVETFSSWGSLKNGYAWTRLR
ncbi:Lrp/AsnC family transcriptional regulator [Nocardioides sp. R1-1]|uniref:Lrp/AsnC family transcriptional regulator n=1 Tax=Nocardioides sp. R1-1 TaxID=3383502 RepID=UPI0038D0E5C9